MESVRTADRDDIARLMELFGELKAEMEDHRGRWYELDSWPEPVEDWFAASIDDPDILVLVGMIEQYPVGYSVTEIRDTLPQSQHSHIGHIREIFVEPAAREVSVGELLLSAAISWLKARSIRSADIAVSPGHRAAKNFCEENGFVARSIIMHSQW